MDMQNNQLRKLAIDETVFDLCQKTGDLILVGAFVIESKIDLFENKVIVEKAINSWKRLHPLLRSKITKSDKETYYFSYLPDDKIDKNDNVLFLNGKSQDCWKNLFEREFHITFDSSNDYSWRLKFIKLDCNSTTTCDTCIIASFNHAITDALNMYYIIIELLETIESTYLNEHYATDEKRTEESIFEYNYPNDPRFITIDKNEKINVEKANIERPKWKHLNGPTKYYKSKPNSFYTIDNAKYLSKMDIIQGRSKYSTGFQTFSLDSTILDKLLNKCHSYEVKLTKCLDLIVATALKRTFKKYASNNELFNSFDSYVTINMRPRLNNPIANYIMGNWATGVHQLYENDLDLNDDLKWFEEFWKLAKTNSDGLHEFLMERKFLDKNVLEDYVKFYMSFLDVTLVEKPDLFYGTYILTNLAALPSVLMKSKGFIRLIESYIGMSYSVYNDSEFAFNSILSINGELFWCITYDKSVLPDEIVLYWIDSMKEIISTLITTTCAKLLS